MMKNWKKVLVSALALTTAAASISGMSAGAVALISSTLEAPTGYVQLDDQTFLKRAVYSSNDVYTVYTDGKAESAGLYIFYGYTFNHTVLTVSDLDAFQKIYAEYQTALDFDQYTESEIKYQDKASEWAVTMYDEKNADGAYSKDPGDFENKKDTVLKLTRALQDAGILLSADYHAAMANAMDGNYYNGLFVDKVDASETAAILKLVRTVDADAEAECLTLEDADESGQSTVNITKVESIYDGVEIAEKLQHAYPNADIGLSYVMSADSKTASSSDIDLTTAHYTGDVDNNSAVDARDAAAVLTYAAKQGAGMDGTLSGGEAPAEAAAFAAADVNGDGAVNAADAAMILQYSAQEGAGMAPRWD